MFKSFLNHIDTEKFFDKKKNIVLALSGGVDSMVLFKLLILAKIEFSVAHFDHLTRNGASTEDAEFVRSQCQAHNIPFHSAQMSDNWKENNFQAEARRQRYAFFASLDYDCLVLAHHADDLEETIVMNFLQGKSLNSIPVKNKNVVRPLLTFTKEDILAFAKSENIAYREDASNQESDYLRNYVRNEILEPLDSKITDHRKRISNLSNRIQKEASLLLELVVRNLALDINEDLQRIPKSKLIEFGSDAAEYLYIYLRDFGFSLTQINNMIDTIDKTGQIFSSSTHEILNNRDELLLREIPMDKSEVHLQLNLEDLIKGVQVSNMILKAELVESYEKRGGTDSILCSAVETGSEFILRNWQDGDQFHPQGMDGKKQSLKKYFTNNKVDRFSKAAQLLLCDAHNRIIWLVGKRADERFCASKEEKKAIRFSVKRI